MSSDLGEYSLLEKLAFSFSEDLFLHGGPSEQHIC